MMIDYLLSLIHISTDITLPLMFVFMGLTFLTSAKECYDKGAKKDAMIFAGCLLYTSLGEKPFRAKQIYEWLHVKLADRFDEMTNLSVKLREKLHYYEVDFLISEGSKINAFEVKSSGSGKHESIREFCRKFSQNINKAYLISQKDAGKEENLLLEPFYLLPFLVK